MWFGVNLFLLLTIYYNDLLILVYFEFEVNLFFTLDVCNLDYFFTLKFVSFISWFF